MNVRLFVIHGIGVNSKGYSAKFESSIRREFNRSLQRILKTRDNLAEELQYHELVWDDVVAQHQEHFLKILIKGEAALKSGGNWWNKITQVVARQKMGIVARFVTDILSYRNPGIYQAIHREIESQIDKCVTDESPISVLGHSLGSVIASNYIYDKQASIGRFHSRAFLWNIFMMGSPLALFSLEKTKDYFTKPVKVEHADGHWINILDKDDLVAYKLKNLNPEYDKAVHADRMVDSGWIHNAHTSYWSKKRVHELIAGKLALDWIAVNKRLEDGASREPKKETL